MIIIIFSNFWLLIINPNFNREEPRSKRKPILMSNYVILIYVVTLRKQKISTPTLQAVGKF